MPNWCKNKLTVTGPTDVVDAFVEKARGPVHQFVQTVREREWEIREDRDPDEPPRVEVFSFHRLVPIPAEGLARPYDDPSLRVPGYKQGYEYEHEAWGIKWGGHDSVLVENVPGRAVYTFTTPWGPGSQFFATLAGRWYPLTFALSYSEECPSRGRIAYKNGEQVVSVEESDCPVKWPKTEPNDAEEGALRAAIQAWQDDYVETHDTWAENLP